MRNVFAVIVAGGSGTRLGGPVPKQFRVLADKPVLWHTLHAFSTAIPEIQIILVLPEEHLLQGKNMKNDFPGISIQVTQGGATRFESVKNGLALTAADSIIMVHDAVRCLVTAALIAHCCEEAALHGSAVPALYATDSIRLETGERNEAVDRRRIRIIQTPQTFKSELILPAFKQPYREEFTDEATVVEHTGKPIHLVPGEDTNIKITRPADLLIAEQILHERKK
ncbi:MAG: 2-C-methyl-D-erythritol 4-phosphate cytidylyltransferase [Chitinophagaceae bacterium]|nr:2-C-methyl-D-erythritol 4-phosphate cytidylyltransferase [Chitinophagaceae bacterium]